MGCPFSSDIGRRLLLLLQSNKQGVVQTGETFRAALTYCASDTELGVCPMCVVESPKIWVALLNSIRKHYSSCRVLKSSRGPRFFCRFLGVFLDEFLGGF